MCRKKALICNCVHAPSQMKHHKKCFRAHKSTPALLIFPSTFHSMCSWLGCVKFYSLSLTILISLRLY